MLWIWFCSVSTKDIVGNLHFIRGRRGGGGEFSSFLKRMGEVGGGGVGSDFFHIKDKGT